MVPQNPPFSFDCTPISLTAQRNGGTRQRNAFQPLQFAPARRGKVHYFRNTALRYSSAVRLPLLFPKKSFGFFGDPIFPLHKGTKTLHHKNGDSDSRPPSFRPTAVFILHLPPGCFRLNLTGWDYNPSVTFGDTSLCTREAFVTAGVIAITVGADIIRPFKKSGLRRRNPSGLPGNPSSVFSATSCRKSTFCSAADGRPLCLLRRHLP